MDYVDQRQGHANSRALYMRIEAAAVADRKRLDDAKAARIAAAEAERKALFDAGQQPPVMGSRSSNSDITKNTSRIGG